MVLFRDYEFSLYTNDDSGEQVMAGVIPADVDVHLGKGRVKFPAGSYEVLSGKGEVTFMRKDNFEAQYTTAETPETLEVKEVKTKKKGGG